MKMSSGLHAATGVPSDRVNHSRGDQNYANWANPILALFGIIAGRLRNFKLNSALDLNVRNTHAQA
jgi:hypothetical protein